MKTRKKVRPLRPIGKALAILAVLSTTACYKATFVERPSDIHRQPTYTQWSHHFILGLVGSSEHDAGELCPDGVSVVRTAGDVATGALTIATLGIYAPRRVHVTCADPGATSSLEVMR